MKSATTFTKTARKTDPLLAYFIQDKEDNPIKQFAKKYYSRPACRCPGCGMRYEHKPLSGLCYIGCRKLTMSEEEADNDNN